MVTGEEREREIRRRRAFLFCLVEERRLQKKRKLTRRRHAISPVCRFDCNAPRTRYITGRLIRRNERSESEGLGSRGGKIIRNWPSRWLASERASEGRLFLPQLHGSPKTLGNLFGRRNGESSPCNLFFCHVSFVVTE